MDDKDVAITELAHVARKLLEQIRDTSNLPGILDQAITNKIDYYASFAITTPLAEVLDPGA